nr:MAG TPA: hypothetical protein [Caudoviricetes sp.]
MRWAMIAHFASLQDDSFSSIDHTCQKHTAPATICGKCKDTSGNTITSIK